MTLIHMDLIFVLGRFPDRKAEINPKFWENDSFRTICRDYGVCRQALQRWIQSDLAEAMERRMEYMALMEELESEILENLDRCP